MQRSNAPTRGPRPGGNQQEENSMKKALAMALGALMVAGSAAPAAAASQIDFSGYYRAYYRQDGNLDRKAYTDSYFGHRLELDFVFTPTDELSVYWALRAPSYARWGNGGNRIGGGGTGGSDLQTRYIYGIIKQDWGNVVIGKVSENLDKYGLGSLGYLPTPDGPWTSIGPFDSKINADAIRYFTKMDNGFGIMAQYAKVGDAYVAGGMEGASNSGPYDGTNPYTPSDTWSDGSWDRYQLEATYQWDTGGASLGLWMDRDAQGTLSRLATGNTALLLPKDPENPDGESFSELGVSRTQLYYINPAFMQTFGDFSTHWEGMYATGKVYGGKNAFGDTDKLKADGYGLYGDFDYNYGPGNVTLGGWLVSGQGYGDRHNDDGADKLNAVSIGNSVAGKYFAPLLVAYNATISPGGGRQTSNVIDKANYGNLPGSNQWAVMVSGKHAFTDDISMNYAVAHMELVNATAKTADGKEFQDKDMGYEADLGLEFKLLDNLTFNTSFGYLFAGDAFKVDADSGEYRPGRDAQDAYLWYNTLTFAF
jgi:hypothetical protein